MVNAWMVIVALVLSVLVFLFNIYFIAYFSSDVDKNAAWLPRIVVWIGLSFSYLMVLTLPWDVANVSLDGGLSITPLWQFLYVFVTVMVVAIVPWFIFYYESYEEEKGCCNQAITATVYTSIFVIAFGVLVAVLYVTVGEAEIPFVRYLNSNDAAASSQIRSSQILSIKVSPIVYMIAVLTLVGWVLFLLFAGVGLTALPMDLINAFRTRVKKLSKHERDEARDSLQHRIKQLLDTAKDVNKMEDGRKKKKLKRMWESAVFLVTKEYEELKQNEEQNCIVPYIYLTVGILCGATSVLWWIHIILFNLTNTNAFLNTMLIDLDRTFGLFGVIAYGIFAFYLLWCVIKGNTRFGLRIPFLFRIHPMEVGKTLMNAFLFNTALIMLSAVVVTQFTSDSFSLYVNETSIGALFVTYVKNLKGLTYVWTVYLYILLGVSGLAFLLLILCPKKKTQGVDIEDLLAQKHIYSVSK